MKQVAFFVHYHIRWSSSHLDWQAFQTKAEAEKEAERLKHPNETYSIVEKDGECPRCAEMKPNVKRCV